jgi:hypothetical protein
MRGLTTSDLDFATAPNSGSAMIDGASIVRLRTPEVRRLFAAIDHDQYDDYVAEHQVETLPEPENVD